MLAYSLQQKNGLEEGDRGLKGNFLCSPPANVHMMMMMATNERFNSHFSIQLEKCVIYEP